MRSSRLALALPLWVAVHLATAPPAHGRDLLALRASDVRQGVVAPLILLPDGRLFHTTAVLTSLSNRFADASDILLFDPDGAGTLLGIYCYSASSVTPFASFARDAVDRIFVGSGERPVLVPFTLAHEEVAAALAAPGSVALLRLRDAGGSALPLPPFCAGAAIAPSPEATATPSTTPTPPNTPALLTRTPTTTPAGFPVGSPTPSFTSTPTQTPTPSDGPTPADPSPTPTRRPGDVNGDDSVDGDDLAQLIAAIYSGAAADVNTDGTTSAADIVALVSAAGS